jgi:hypothetical protein
VKSEVSNFKSPAPQLFLLGCSSLSNSVLPSFSPLKTQKTSRSNQNQTDSGQKINRWPPRPALRDESVPRLLKPIEGYSSLLKPFFNNPFFIGSHIWRSRGMAQHIGLIPFKGVLKAESKSRKPMQGKKSILNPPSSPLWDANLCKAM